MSHAEAIGSPAPGDIDFRIGVIRGGRDYQVGPLGYAERSFAAGEVLREVENLDEVRIWAEGQRQWSAPVRSNPVADILALREDLRGRFS